MKGDGCNAIHVSVDGLKYNKGKQAQLATHLRSLTVSYLEEA